MDIQSQSKSVSEEDNRAYKQAEASMNYFIDLYARLDNSKTDKEKEDIETELDESDYGQDVERIFHITLAGGGPAVRITGDLDEHNQPDRAWLEYSDWGTPWTEFRGADREILLRYAERHIFDSE